MVGDELPRQRSILAMQAWFKLKPYGTSSMAPICVPAPACRPAGTKWYRACLPDEVRDCTVWLEPVPRYREKGRTLEHLFWKIPLGERLEDARQMCLVDSGDTMGSLHINLLDGTGTLGDKRDHNLRLCLCFASMTTAS